MQGDWTVCVPFDYLILVSDIQEAKCSELTVQTLPPPPPLGAYKGGGQKNYIGSETSG